MWPSDIVAAAKAAFWGLVILVVGLLAGYLWLRAHGDHSPVVAVTVPPLLPTIHLPAPPSVTIALEPTPTPSPPPAAVATASSHARIIIERPVFPPYPGGPASYGNYNGPFLAPMSGATDGAVPMERIIIDAGGDATATAPIVTPAPSVTPAPTEAAAASMVGVTLGTFPGNAALDLEPVRFTILGRVAIGPTVLAGQKIFGVGGAIALVGAGEHLYFEGGVSQPYVLTPSPRPFLGFGYRF